MSQPRQVPAHSSSPSKSSLRRPNSIGGAPQQTQTSARSLLPSPHFEDDPIVASHQSPRTYVPLVEHAGIDYSEHAVGDEGEESLVHYSGEAEHEHEPPVLPITFQPFFALIEDSVSNEHYHPTVHYIFADDDSDIIAEAACRSLEDLDPSQRPATSQTQSQAQHEEGLSQSRLPPSAPGVREHYLILDLNSRLNPAQPASQQTPVPSSSPGTTTSLTPFGVTSAHSLSAEWQVLQTKITAAPTIGDGDGEDDEGLMLRIEGRGNTPGDGAGEKERERDVGKESMEEMIDRFKRRMDEIKLVLETGAGEE